MSHRNLKEWLEAHPELTDEQAIAAINAPSVVVGERLTKAELATFFIRHPVVELKLRAIAQNPPTDLTNTQAVAVWGLAVGSLRMLDLPGVEYSVYELVQAPLNTLRALNIVDDQQLQALLDVSTSKISLAEQWLGEGYVVSQPDLDFARGL